MVASHVKDQCDSGKCVSASAVEESFATTLDYATPTVTLNQTISEKHVSSAQQHLINHSPPLQNLCNCKQMSSTNSGSQSRPMSSASSAVSCASSVRELRLEQRRRDYETSLSRRPGSAASSCYSGVFQRNISTPDLEVMRERGKLRGKDLQAYLLAQRMADLHKKNGRFEHCGFDANISSGCSAPNPSTSTRHLWQPSETSIKVAQPTTNRLLRPRPKQSSSAPSSGLSASQKRCDRDSRIAKRYDIISGSNREFWMS